MSYDEDEKALRELETAADRRADFQSHLSEWFNYLLTLQYHLNSRWRMLKIGVKRRQQRADDILMIDPITKRTWRWHERVLKDEEAGVIQTIMEWHRDLVDQAVPLTQDTLSHLSVTPAQRRQVWNTQSLPDDQKMSKPMTLSLSAPISRKRRVLPAPMSKPTPSTSGAARPKTNTIRITYAGMLFSIQCMACLCKMPAIGPDASLVFAGVLPKSLQTGIGWIKTPETSILSQGILRRLRLWTSGCSRSMRSAETWPSKQQIEDATALVSAVGVYFYAGSALAASESPDLVKAAAWAEDEKVYRRLREWDPPAGIQRREDEKIEETEAQLRAKERSKKITRQQYEKLVKHTTYDLPNGIIPASSTVSVGMTYQETYLADEEEEAKEEKKAEQSTDDIEAETVKNRGRFWGDNYHSSQFLNEAEALLYHIGLNEYVYLTSGTLSPTLPFTILASHKEAMMALMRKEASVSVETDDWQTSFSEFVYEESIGMECATLHRNGLLTDILNGGKAVASFAKAAGKPADLLLKEFGYTFSENMLYCSEDSKSNMFDREHDLHDLFLIHFFCSTFHRYSFAYKAIEADSQSSGVDFMARYFIPQSMIEAYGRTELLKQKREAERRRPLIVFLRKRWMLHDFIEVGPQTANALKLGAKTLSPKDVKRAFLDPMDDLGENENPKTVLGVWFEFDNPLEALIGWLFCVHHRYRCLLEDGTEILHLTRELFGDPKEE